MVARQNLHHREFILAVGSQSVVLPGIECDGKRVGTSTDALSFPEVPEHLVVIGGGYIGLELGSVWRRLGSRVTVLEYSDRILTGIDSEIASDALVTVQKTGPRYSIRCQSAVSQSRGRRLCHPFGRERPDQL